MSEASLSPPPSIDTRSMTFSVTGGALRSEISGNELLGGIRNAGLSGVDVSVENSPGNVGDPVVGDTGDATGQSIRWAVEHICGIDDDADAKA